MCVPVQGSGTFAVEAAIGHPRVVMEVVIDRARAQGFVADCVISSDDVPLGRPSPFPTLKALAELGVYPVEAAAKIGDTVVDIEEGLNGGMWSVGLAVSGNEVGPVLDDIDQRLARGEKP